MAQDFWDDAKTVLSTVAPTLATAVGGPLAGIATRAIISAFGLEPDTTSAQAAALAVQNATPEQLLALKKADEDFAVQMRKLDISVEQMGADNVANARAREIAVKDSTPRVLAYVAVIGFLAATFAVLMGYAKIESALAGTLIGYLSAKSEQVLAYYFGSSAGSEAKNTLLYNSMPATAPPRPLR